MQIFENSRIWIYQSNRVFTPEETLQIQQRLDEFTTQWQAHGQQLVAKGEIRYSLFIILSVDEQQAGATGCSIDKSVNLMKKLEQEFNINLFDRFQTAYWQDETILTCNRETLEQLIKEGKITPETIVFNNMLTSHKELETQWQVPFKKSWHAQMFMVSAG